MSTGHTESVSMSDKALEGSIQKWERIVAGKGIDRGADNCPLCVQFALRDGHCGGCPVSQKVGQSDCAGTPYMQWHQANPWPEEGRQQRKVITQQHREAAQAELNFLKSLLPHRPDEQRDPS